MKVKFQFGLFIWFLLSHDGTDNHLRKNTKSEPRRLQTKFQGHKYLKSLQLKKKGSYYNISGYLGETVTDKNE